MENPLISKKLNGILFIFGLILILIYSIITYQSLEREVALLGALVLASIFLNNPRWGTLLILAIRPSIDQMGERLKIFFGQNLSFSFAAIFGVFVIILLGIFIFSNRDIFKKNNLLAFWALFILISSLSIIWSIDYFQSIYEILRIVSISLIFFSVYIIAKKENSFNFIFKAILFSSIIPLIFAIFQLLTGSGLGGTTGIESRIFSTFSHPNHFASFLLIIAASIFFIIYKDKKIRNNLAFLFLMLVTMIVFVETYSRGAWLALLIFFLIIGVVKFKKIIPIIISSCLLIFFIFDTVRDRIEDVYNPPADSSIVWRFDQWERMGKIFRENYWQGVGIGNETLAFEREYGFYAGNPYTHNDYIRIAMECGVFGFLAYIIMIVASFVFLINKYIKEKDSDFKNFHFFVIALFFSVALFAVSDNILRQTSTQWLLWALVGTSLGISKRNIPEK